MRTERCETDPQFEGKRYSINGFDGVACWIDGWELEPLAIWSCPDCNWTHAEREYGGGYAIDKGDENCDHADAYQSDEPEWERTGNLLAVMVGDNHRHVVSPADIFELAELDYCDVCGQIGCTHDGRFDR